MTFSGSLATSTGSTMQFLGGMVQFSSGFTNYGTMVFQGHEVDVESGAVINAPGATITASPGENDYDGALFAELNNAGTIDIADGQFAVNPDWDGSPWTTWYDANWKLTNTGTIQLSSGSFAFGGQFDPTRGTIQGSGGLECDGGTLNLGSNWTPAVDLALAPGSPVNVATSSVEGPGKLIIASGRYLALCGGTIDTTVENDGVIAVVGGTETADLTPVAAQIKGTLTMASSSTLVVGFDQQLYDASPFASWAPPSGWQFVDASLTVANGFTNDGKIELSGVDGGSSLTVTSGTLVNAADGTIASTIDSQSTATPTNAIHANVDNRGALNVARADLAINQATGDSAAALTNAAGGTIDVSGGQTLTVGGAGVDDEGTFKLEGNVVADLATSLTIDGKGALQGSSASTLKLGGSLQGNTTNVAAFVQPGTVVLDGGGTASSPQKLELMEPDQGNVAAGYSSGLAYGTLQLGHNTCVELENLSQNSPGTGPEAGYVHTLVVPADSTLEHNGLNLYTWPPSPVLLVTSTTLATNLPKGSVFGQVVTLSATVSAATGTPTGSVTFMDGATTLGTIQLSGGKAACAVSTLLAGSHSIKAVYSGDSSYAASQSAPVSQTVSRDGTTTTLHDPVNPSIAGQRVTFTATVIAVAPGAGTPTGKVTFKDRTKTLGVATLSAGTATYTTSALSVGSHRITVVYGGDGDFLVGNSAVDTHKVERESKITLTTSPDPSVFGQKVTLKATVAATTKGAGTPTGSVTFMEGSSTLGTAKLSAGKATLTISNLSIGVHSVTAVYGGSGNFAASTSASFTQTVNQGHTTTALGISKSQSTYRQALTMLATVKPTASGAGSPTGTVTFKDGTAVLGTAKLSGGKATLVISTLAVGSHKIMAVYNGDGNFAASTSVRASQTVVRAPTKIAIIDPNNQSTYGQKVTLSATVKATVAGAGTPTGSVTFKRGMKTLGIAPLIGGTATLSISTLPVGTSAITAVYDGDGDFLTSASPVERHKVRKA